MSQYSTPVLQHTIPVLQNTTPVLQYTTPVLHYSTPVSVVVHQDDAAVLHQLRRCQQ